jgi:hypothetical protein
MNIERLKVSTNAIALMSDLPQGITAHRPVTRKLAAALVVAIALSASPVFAGSSTYFGGGAAVFERVIKTYGPKVGQDVKDAYSKIKKVVAREATRTAAKEAAKKLVKGVATKTAVGVVVDLLWATRLDPR